MTRAFAAIGLLVLALSAFIKRPQSPAPEVVVYASDLPGSALS